MFAKIMPKATKSIVRDFATKPMKLTNISGDLDILLKNSEKFVMDGKVSYTKNTLSFDESFAAEVLGDAYHFTGVDAE